MFTFNNFLSFEYNKNTLVITNSNKNEIVGFSLVDFFNKMLTCERLGEFVENYNFNIFNNFIMSDKDESALFHVINSPLYYHFIKTNQTSDCVMCVIERRSVNENLTTKTNIDYLSGVYSRSYLMSLFKNNMINPATESFYFFIIDINNFKHINDTFGHRVGDEALRKFSQKLLEISGDNLLGRYGGDEFLLFCVNKTKQQIVDIANKIINCRIEVEFNGEKIDVTCCCGITFSQDKSVNFDFLLKKADKALYSSKKKGKNVVYLDNELIAKNSNLIFKNNQKHNGGFKRLDEELKSLKYKHTVSVVCLLFSFLLFFVFFTKSFSEKINNNTIDEAKNTIASVSTEFENKLKVNVESWISQLQLIALNVYNGNNVFDNKQALGEQLSYYSSLSDFSQLALIDTQGKIFIDKDNYFDIVETAMYNDIILQNNSFYFDAVNFLSKNDRSKMVIAIPYRYKSNDENFTVGICGIISYDLFCNYLSTDTFNKSAIVSIVRPNGDVFASSNNFDREGVNILDYLNENSTGLDDERIKKMFTDENYKIDTINLYDKEHFIYVTFFNIFGDNDNLNDFLFVFLAPSSNVLVKVNKTIKTINVILYFVIFGILAGLFLALLFNYKHKVSILQISSIDARTNGLNYARFRKDCAILTKQNSHTDYAFIFVQCTRFNLLSHGDEQKRNELIKTIFDVINSSITENELATRIYMDRFVIALQNDCSLQNRLTNIINNVKSSTYEKHNENVGVISGVYINTNNQEEIEYAVDMARLAVSYTIGNGNNDEITMYNDKMLISSIENQTIKDKGIIALRNNEFEVFLQPKRNIIDDKWDSAEALVRWFDPVEGLIFPGRFVPVFEKEGLIIQLDIYVFKKVCSYINGKVQNGEKVLPISINLSRKHIDQKNIMLPFKNILNGYNFDHSLIRFELTESMIAENENLVSKMIQQIHEMGCTCSIDDFGVGYSSLSLMTKFDFDEIKLDRSFFYGKNGFDDNNRMVVGAIIELCKNLCKDVVAEGVEDFEMIRYLKEKGCNCVQSFAFSKPVPFNEFEQIIKE